MTLIEIYDFIKFMGNKDFNGNFFKPEHFQSALIMANLDLFKKRTGLPEEYQPGHPVPRDFKEVNSKSLSELRRFKEHVDDQAVASGYFAIPADFIGWDSMTYDYVHSIDGTPTTFPRPVELLTESELSDRRGNYTKQPSTKYPVAVIRSDDTNDRIYIYPDTINSVDWHYYRLPAEPDFQYVITDDELVYDTNGSTELEWPSNLHNDIVRLLLSYLGLNLREAELVQYAEMQKEKGV